jgi:hypothetical protein
MSVRSLQAAAVLLCLAGASVAASAAFQQSPPRDPGPPNQAGKTCGDSSGPNGRDVSCACGDTVTTDTTLRYGRDPVTRVACPASGLIVAPGVALNLNGQTITGSGAGIGIEARAGSRISGGAVRGFSIGLAAIHGDAVLTSLAVEAHLGAGLVVDPSISGAAAVTFGGAASSVSDNGGPGVIVQPGAALAMSGTNAAARLPVRGNGGIGIDVRGALIATQVDVSDNGHHGVRVESASPVEIVDSSVHGNGGNPPAGTASGAGVLALQASHDSGLVIRGTEGSIRYNAGHGVVLGHLTEQTGAVNGLVQQQQISGNEIGIQVQQKDMSAAATYSTILGNNVFGNRNSGVYISTSYQRYTNTPQQLAFNGNDVHRNAVTPADADICTAAAGAVQSASQIVFNGPIAGTDPMVPFDVGPDPVEYPADYRCFWGATPGGTRISSHTECNNVNNPALPVSGGVNNHCVWIDTQCRVAWDMGGTESAGMCDNSSNRIFNYVNSPTAAPVTQRGVAALSGAVVRARRNFWGSGGADAAIAVDGSASSRVDAGNPCGAITSCVGYDTTFLVETPAGPSGLTSGAPAERALRTSRSR